MHPAAVLFNAQTSEVVEAHKDIVVKVVGRFAQVKSVQNKVDVFQ